jgi:hypothetical protein
MCLHRLCPVHARRGLNARQRTRRPARPSARRPTRPMDAAAAPCYCYCYCRKSLRTLMKAPGPPSSASSCTSASVCWTRRSMAAELDLPKLTVGGVLVFWWLDGNAGGDVKRAYLVLRCSALRRRVCGRRLRGEARGCFPLRFRTLSARMCLPVLS